MNLVVRGFQIRIAASLLCDARVFTRLTRFPTLRDADYSVAPLGARLNNWLRELRFAETNVHDLRQHRHGLLARAREGGIEQR